MARRSDRKGRSSNVWLESFQAHRSLLSRLVARFVKPHEIEDIVQETFVRSYVAANKQQIRDPRAFLLKTARNVAMDHLRSASSRLNCSFDEGVEHGSLTDAPGLESQSEWRQRFLIFCQAVSNLPLNCRRAFVLKKVYGLSHKEIAAYLKISESTVNKHIVKGMVLTAQFMTDRGYFTGESTAARERRAGEGQRREQ